MLTLGRRLRLSTFEARPALTLLLVGAAYYFGSLAGIALRFPLRFATGGVSALWPPNALLLAVLLLTPPRRWWAFLLVSLPAHFAVLAPRGLPPSMMAIAFAHNMAQVLIAASTIRLFLGREKPRLDSLRQTVVYTLAAVVAAPVLTSVPMAAYRMLAGSTDEFGLVWRAFVLSDALTFLILTPAFLNLLTARYGDLRQTPPRRIAEAALLSVALVASGLTVFDGARTGSALATASLLCVPLPLLLWTAVRFGPGGLSLSLLAVTLVALVGGIHGRGPFGATDDLLALQIFLIALALPLTFLAALVEERRRAEQAGVRLAGLMEGERRRLDDIISSIPGMVWEAHGPPEDPAQRNVFISDQAEALTGYAPAEFRDKTRFWAALIPEEERERTIGEGMAIFRSQQPGTLKARWQRKNGEIIWVESHMAPVCDETGAVVGMRGVTMDITKRVRAEEELRASEARNRAILSALPDLIFVQTRDGVYVDFHTRYPEDLLVPPECFLGKSMHEILPSGLADSIARCFKTILKSEDGGPAVVEYSLPLGGVERFFEARMVRGDDEGRTVLSIIRDVTDRRRAQQALQESEKRYALAIEAGHVSVYDVNLENGILYADPLLYRLIGLSPASVHTREEWLNRIHPEDQQRVRAHQAAALADDAPRDAAGNTPLPEIEYRTMAGDDRTRWVLNRSTVLRRPDGTPYRAVGTVVDITDRKRVEEALRRRGDELRRTNRRIRELTAQVLVAQEEERRRLARELHDGINQQVAAVAIALSRVRQHTLQPGKDPGASEQIREQFETLQLQVGQLSQDIRRLSHDLHPAILENAGLPAALRAAVADLGRNASLDVELCLGRAVEGASIPPEVALCLYRVAQEALGNAARHAGAGRVRVSLDAISNGYHLSVADDGRGFDPEEARRQSGGLGLINMEERVRQLGGWIRVDTRPGAGTTVRAFVSLPQSPE